MSDFIKNIEFEVVNCADCGVTFALTDSYIQRRRRDAQTFYCPSGHPNVYNQSKTKAQKLQAKLDESNRKLLAQQTRAMEAEQKADQLTKQYQRIKTRVQNGVCPCCNRTFDNLRRHIETKHPDFDNHKLLKVLRVNYGLTQSALAESIGVSSAQVSNYENSKKVPAWVSDSVEQWLARNG